ncbi:hypothetical protein [Niallia sp. 01092]|uniref:hypothetical protein n=1 Tax=unclassified Niallia TaxID=2837522 RepID=UPI003FD16F67
MKTRKKVSTFLGTLALVGALSFGIVDSASAYSDQTTVPIPELSGNSIQSNAWMSNTAFYQKQSYQVSAKFLGYNPPNADWVKTAWTIKANGLGVSIGGVSGGTANDNTLTGTWTNYNTWISDYSGSYSISGVPISGGADNTASFLARGVKRSASASIFRWY